MVVGGQGWTYIPEASSIERILPDSTQGNSIPYTHPLSFSDDDILTTLTLMALRASVLCDFIAAVILPALKRQSEPPRYESYPAVPCEVIIFSLRPFGECAACARGYPPHYNLCCVKKFAIVDSCRKIFCICDKTLDFFVNISYNYYV